MTAPAFAARPAPAGPYAGWIVEPPEPRLVPSAGRIAGALGLGLIAAVAAVVASLVVVLGLLGSPGGPIGLGTAVVIAPFIEESCKGFGSLLVGFGGRRPLLPEGWMVLGATVGFGFSVLENVAYAASFGRYSATYGALLLAERFLLSSPIHMLAAGLVAYGIGLLRWRAATGRGLAAVVGGVAVHGGANAWFLKLGGAW